jgi:hypothetical protein
VTGRSRGKVLDVLPGGDEQVMRSSQVTVVSPVGDLVEPARRLEWRSVSGAARYRVSILEADRSELWSTNGQFVALAVQNPNPGPVSVTFQLQSTGATTSIVLPSGGRIKDELGALLGGLSVNAGDVVKVNATAGVQILGLIGDENATTVTPFLPTF